MCIRDSCKVCWFTFSRPVESATYYLYHILNIVCLFSLTESISQARPPSTFKYQVCLPKTLMRLTTYRPKVVYWLTDNRLTEPVNLQRCVELKEITQIHLLIRPHRRHAFAIWGRVFYNQTTDSVRFLWKMYTSKWLRRCSTLRPVPVDRSV